MKNAGIAIGRVAIGAGLATIGLNMNGGGTAAHANAPMVQAGGPTIVWYGVAHVTTVSTGEGTAQVLYRAWSDGTIELKRVEPMPGVPGAWQFCNTDVASEPCSTPWYVVSSPTQGLAAAADINFDQRVDGADIGMLLGSWGDAPRSPVPPSDCPLAMINP